MRTNKTTQAINRALNTLSNPMHIPRTLSTTMGYELTFMPCMFDRMHIKSKGAVKAWSYYSDYVVGMSKAMRDYAQSVDKTCSNRFRDFKTDPMVVEVTTHETNNGARLRNIVRDAFKYAAVADLQPRALVSRGGGAHLHVGIPAKSSRGWDAEDDAIETNKDAQAFAAAMQHEIVLNPWFAWAFANPLDGDNAQQIPHMTKRTAQSKAQHSARELQQKREGFMRDMEHIIRDKTSDIVLYNSTIIRLTNEMHMACNWKPAFNNYPKEWSCPPDDIADYVRYKKNARKSLLRYEKQLLTAMESDYAEHVLKLWDEAIIEDAMRNMGTQVVQEDTRPVVGCDNWPVTPWHEMKTMTGKCYAATHRLCYNTIEFRAFMMYEHHADHAKQITLADALVKRAMHKVKTCEGVRMYTPIESRKLRDMKYSEAKAAFCNWLASMDIDPAYYREECVNIALRKRALRVGKVRV